MSTATKKKREAAEQPVEPAAEHTLESQAPPTGMRPESERTQPGVRLETYVDKKLKLEFGENTRGLVERLGLQVRLDLVDEHRLRLEISQTPDKFWEFSAMGVTPTKGR